MPYYKVRFEAWFNSDPEYISLEELVRQLVENEAVCTLQQTICVVDRPQDIEDPVAMVFFGGEEGDAELSQG